MTLKQEILTKRFYNCSVTYNYVYGDYRTGNTGYKVQMHFRFRDGTKNPKFNGLGSLYKCIRNERSFGKGRSRDARWFDTPEEAIKDQIEGWVKYKSPTYYWGERGEQDKHKAKLRELLADPKLLDKFTQYV